VNIKVYLKVCRAMRSLRCKGLIGESTINPLAGDCTNLNFNNCSRNYHAHRNSVNWQIQSGQPRWI